MRHQKQGQQILHQRGHGELGMQNGYHFSIAKTRCAAARLGHIWIASIAIDTAISTLPVSRLMKA